MRKLCKDYASSFAVVFVREALEVIDGYPDTKRDQSKVAFYCDKCGEAIKGIDFIRKVDYSGNGGIGITFFNMVCDDCFDIGSCQICKEYGDYENAYCPDEVEKNHDYCNFHKHYKVFELLEQGEIKAVEQGVQILELYAIINKAEKQLEMLRDHQNVNMAAQYRGWQENKSKIENEIIALWKQAENQFTQYLIIE